MRRRARFGIGTTLFEKPGAAAEKLAAARAMRVFPTEAEVALWRALRARRVGGFKFRRQQVIVGYIVDFYCAEVALAIEVDGSIHQKQHEDDRQRDHLLARRGVSVVRVPNGDVLERLAATLAQIASHCRELAAKRRARPSRRRGR
jgi:very-short-patch-repair endonuclease